MTLGCASDDEKPMCAEQVGPDPAHPSNSTAALIRSARLGDQTARHTLLKRFLPLLLRWAHGRLPLTVRDVNDTEDFVQIALIKALKQLASFNSDRPGSFLIYLRRILLNQVRDEVRKRRSRPKTVELDESIPEDEQGATQLERIIGGEQLDAYQSAVARLPKRQQELVIMRLEFGLSYPEIAAEVCSTADAVRVMVARAVAKLAIELDEVR
jgi:RNA polymerase sigma-70 factor (ECF subfamily)